MMNILNKKNIMKEKKKKKIARDLICFNESYLSKDRFLQHTLYAMSFLKFIHVQFKKFQSLRYLLKQFS